MISTIVLTGVKHSGKSRVGKALSVKLEYTFVDLDDALLEECQQVSGVPYETTRELFRAEGSAGFRHWEAEALRKILAKNTSIVIATGGGICENAEALPWLENEFIIFLDGDFTLLWERVQKGGIPPFLDTESPEDSFRELFDRRKRLYQTMANLRVDINHQQVDRTLEMILSGLNSQ